MPAPDPWLTTERLVLHPPTTDDVDAVFRIHADPRTYQHAPHLVMRTLDEAATRLSEWRQHWDEHGFGYAVVRETGDAEVVGFAGGQHHELLTRPMLNLFYRFGPDHWGKGFAVEAMTRVVTELQGTFPRVPLVARVARVNAASCRLAERLGLSRGTEQDPNDPIEHWIYTL